jgi:hypothetical protein
MKTLVYDNTRGLMSDSFAESCFDVGIGRLEYRPSPKPNLKAMEQFFRNLYEELKFHNGKENPAPNSESNKVNPIKIPNSLSLNQLHQLIHVWLIDEYAQAFNKRYGGHHLKFGWQINLFNGNSHMK